MLIAFNKPYGVLCQFTSAEGKPTLADYIDVPRVYAAGRLDFDSEGLVLLTDDGRLQHAIADPAHHLVKRYRAQVEGVADEAALERLRRGVEVGTGRDRYPARVEFATAIDAPALPERDPPIRYRAHLPTSWIELGLAEGRNRQVRRTTAAAGLPTLRLVRVAIGALALDDLGLDCGAWREVDAQSLGSPLEMDTKPRTRAPRPLSTPPRRRRY